MNRAQQQQQQIEQLQNELAELKLSQYLEPQWDILAHDLLLLSMQSEVGRTLVAQLLVVKSHSYSHQLKLAVRKSMTTWKEVVEN